MHSLDTTGMPLQQSYTHLATELQSHKKLTVVFREDVEREVLASLCAKENCEFQILEEGIGFVKVLITQLEEEKGIGTGGMDYCVLIASEGFGEGEAPLGELLMKNYLYSLGEVANLPLRIILVHGGVKLLSKEDALESLKTLEQKGVEILCCGTCLDYYGMKKELSVGMITNMYEVADIVSLQKVVRI